MASAVVAEQRARQLELSRGIADTPSIRHGASAHRPLMWMGDDTLPSSACVI